MAASHHRSPESQHWRSIDQNLVCCHGRLHRLFPTGNLFPDLCQLRLRFVRNALQLSGATIPISAIVVIAFNLVQDGVSSYCCTISWAAFHSPDRARSMAWRRFLSITNLKHLKGHGISSWPEARTGPPHSSNRLLSPHYNYFCPYPTDVHYAELGIMDIILSCQLCGV